MREGRGAPMILLAAFIMGCSVLRQEAVLPVGSPRSCSWPPPCRWWGPTPPSPASFMMGLALDDGAPSRWRAESTLSPLSFLFFFIHMYDVTPGLRALAPVTVVTSLLYVSVRWCDIRGLRMRGQFKKKKKKASREGGKNMQRDQTAEVI